jgi:putative FmdB family regulatory protein
MPTYEYACDNCGHEFERFQSITAKPLRKCPVCGKSRLRRLIGTGGGVIFKGSGFYETDYRSESYKKAAEAEKNATSGSSKDGESKKGGDSTASSDKKKEAGATGATSSAGSADSSEVKPAKEKSGTRRVG